MPAFHFDISSGSPAPIFRQIVDQVRLAVARGQLSPGDALPSVRSLAEKLLVNPNTVAKAYTELSRDGVIESQQGRGVFIAAPREIYSQAERNRRVGPLVDALAQEGITLGFSSEELLEKLEESLRKLGASQVSRRKKS